MRYQVQQWYGIKENAERRGWKTSKNGLIPVTTLEPPAPEAFLKLISCKCKKGCQRACGCRKAGLKCSFICTNCNGTCDNLQVPSQDSDEEEEAETALEIMYHEIDEERDDNGSDNPIPDDLVEISISDVSIGTEDD